MLRRLPLLLALSLATWACSSAQVDDGAEEESALSSSFCRGPAIKLQPGVNKVSSTRAGHELAPVPDCGTGSRASVAVYKFRVPEPGVVKIDSIDTPAPVWRLQSFRGTQCQRGDQSQSVCERNAAHPERVTYGTYYFDYSPFVRPGDDLVVGVAGIDGGELVAHELSLTFEPTCGNGRAEDYTDGGRLLAPGRPKHFEECEDGDRVSGDGCSSSCKIESACTLTVPATAREKLVVVDVPAKCRTARLKGKLPSQATVVARINATNDASVTATVLDVDPNVRYHAPAPTSGDDPFLAVTIGPAMPETSYWGCGLDTKERCAVNACIGEASLCRVRYESSGGKTYVRVANGSPYAHGPVSFDVRIDRNLAAIFDQ